MAAINGLTASITFSAGYTTNAFQWEMNISAEKLDTTPFAPTSGYKTGVTGLLEGTGSYQCYVDGTTALPVAGVTGSATFTAATGRAYSGTIMVDSVRVGVSVDGSQRVATIGFFTSGAVTPA